MDVPQGLSRRASTFLRMHGLRGEVPGGELSRDRWLEEGIPAEQIDRVSAYHQRWGGLILPPSPRYDGGPRIFVADTPERAPGGGWWFEAGVQRAALPYAFMIGPRDEFGIHGDRWVPLHESMDGWVESLALAHHVAHRAQKITRVTGSAVDALQLEDYELVPEIAGLADTWWRGSDSLVSICTGTAECYAHARLRVGLIYSGLDDWGLHG